MIRPIFSVIFILAAPAIGACSGSSSADGGDASVDSEGASDSIAYDARPIDAASLFSGVAPFTDVAASAGLPAIGGTCLVFDDFDGDARPDLFFASFFGAPVSVALYVNQGAGAFVAKPLAALDFGGKSPSPGWCAAGDVDGDGKLDVVLGSFSDTRAHVLRNVGGGAFVDAQTLRSDAPGAVGYSAIALADFDGDGFLDVVATPYGLAPKLDLSSCKPVADGYACLADGDRCLPPPVVFRNSGVVSTGFLPAVPIVDASACGPANTNALAIVDWNGDGLPDVFAANDWGSNRLYVEAAGLHFADVFPALGTKPYNSAMGAAFEDFDLDGRTDLYVADMGSDQLYLGVPSGPLVEHASDFGVAAPTRFHSGWSPLGEDFDSDGFPDVFVASAAFVGSYDELASVGGRGTGEHRVNDDVLLRSDHGHGFIALGLPQTLAAEPTPEFGATAVADYDSDGKLDIAEAIGFPMRIQLLHNESAPQHWIEVRLRGHAPNVDGIGATVTLKVAGKPAWNRYVTRSRGTNGGSWATLHFGLGAATSVDAIDVEWPDGESQTVDAPKVDAVLAISEP